ncbi:MAG: toll/interleukin-1 receptor domain-containing protein [Deltaproteobacteria bacterium]|nr:toll/interleukin-1 receptor domain-containing protein [Deltaproteobacteria bacterium]
MMKVEAEKMVDKEVKNVVGFADPESMKDIFFCHASEDKSDIVEPLVIACEKEGISYWYDEAEIKWGDSIPQKINEGLEKSRYVVVILSESFIKKNWPKRELDSQLNIEASSGEVRILPLLSGTGDTKIRILSKYPILNDKSYLTWDNNPSHIIDKLKTRLNKTNISIKPKKREKSVYVEKKVPVYVDKVVVVEKEIPKIEKDIQYIYVPIPTNTEPQKNNFDIPLPKIRKKFTQRESDKFLKNSFGILRTYFQKALSKLQAQNDNVETDFDEVNKFKFVCTIYLHGDVANKCKIWVGGPISNDTIAYYEGNFNFDNDNSCNDWLDVCNDGFDLGLKASGATWSGLGNAKDKIMSPEKAAEYLWVRFTNHVNLS